MMANWTAKNRPPDYRKPQPKDCPECGLGGAFVQHPDGKSCLNPRCVHSVWRFDEASQ